jgi:hypothetical protein
MEVARLEAEMNAGEAALVRFAPRAATAHIPAPTASSPRNAEIAQTARDAYKELRIKYQCRFATDEIEALKKSGRIGSTIADLLYVAGVVLAILSLVVNVSISASETVTHWIDFLAVSCFMMGLLKAIMDNASLGETSQGRYEDYVRSLDECDAELTQENATFPETVLRIERTALSELAQFCQAALRISYRL